MGATRRDILRAGLAAGLSAGVSGLLPFPGLRGLAFAAEAGRPNGLLVIVHLRGGCDGLNLVSPASDPDFIAARGTDLSVAASGPDVGAAGGGGLGAMRSIGAGLPGDAQHRVQPYQAEHEVNYDAAGDLGRALRTVAQLAKMELGLAVAAVDIGGWDTHEYQPGRFR